MVSPELAQKHLFLLNLCVSLNNKNKTDLYTSWRVHGSYFNKMIDCGSNHNHMVEMALKYIPADLLWDYRNEIVFIGMGARDACRVAPALREEKEIIILAGHIFPKRGAKEDDAAVRYFIFAVLHEIAHVIKQHRSPLLDNLTKEEAQAQETEADELAQRWFNTHVEERNNPYLKPITLKEIDKARAKNQIIMEELYEKG